MSDCGRVVFKDLVEAQFDALRFREVSMRTYSHRGRWLRLGIPTGGLPVLRHILLDVMSEVRTTSG